jgi:ABC-type Fe3+/spermidine/putrescine transport system ATPase subunit
MVFQSGAIWPHMTVAQNIGFPLACRRVSKAAIARRVAEMLELVGLRGLGDRHAPLLSGGQQQRVAIARALVTAPGVLLLDEPFNGLDTQLRELLRRDIRRLQRELGIAIVLVTHDLAEALGVSDRIVVMKDGEIQQQGPPETLYEYPTNAFVRDFLGRSTRVRGRIVQHTDSTSARVTLDGTESACVEVRLAQPEPCGAGDAVEICVRPEDVRMHASGDSGRAGHLRGVVRARTFVGDRFEYEIEVRGQGIWRTYGPRRAPIAEGGSVWLELRASDLTAWPRQI